MKSPAPLYVLIIFLLICCFSVNESFGAKNPKKTKLTRIKSRSVSAIEFLASDANVFPQSIPANYGAALNQSSSGTIIGETLWDEQHSQSMNRQIEHLGTNKLHFTWTDLESVSGEALFEMAYNAVSLSSGCSILHGPDGAKGQAGDTREGSLDVYPGTNFAICAAAVSVAEIMYPATYWDFGWQMGMPNPFGTYTIDYPTDNFGWGASEYVGIWNSNMYPYIEFQNGTEEVLHMTTIERNPGKKTISYYRRVGSYGFDINGSPNGTWSDQKVIDTIGYGDARVVASTISDKVAIVWIAPAEFFRDDPIDEYENGWLNDVYYIMSTQQGADWMVTTPLPSLSQEANEGNFTEINITNYQEPPDDESYAHFETAWSESQAMFDHNDKLHVIWGTRFSRSPRIVTWRDAALWHWAEDQGKNLIYKPKEYGVSPESYCAAISYNMLNIGGFAIAECIAGGNSGNLYVTFTRFGTDDDACNDRDLVTLSYIGAGNLNGYLYYVGSDNEGVNWDRPQRVSDIVPTVNGCYPDSTNEWTCNTEIFGTMARYSRTETCGDNVGNEVLDIFYINDHAPGRAWASQKYTYNPMIWRTMPCRDIVYEPIWADLLISEGLGICYSQELLSAAPGETVIDTIIALNPGLLENSFYITVDYINGDGWVTANPSSGVIQPDRSDTVYIELSFSPPPENPDPFTNRCNINIHNDAYGSPRTIPVCLTVASELYLPQYADIATTCKQIRIYNNGRTSGEGLADISLDYIDECDTFGNANSQSYFFGSSIVFAWNDGSPQLCTDISADNPFDSRTSRAMSDLVVDESTYDDYIFATGDFTTYDSTINATVEYYIPKSDTVCEFIIKKLYVASAAGTKNDVLLGYIWDWDVPSDSGADNTSFADVERQLLYLQGLEGDNEGEAEALADCGIAPNSDDRFGGVRFLPTEDVPSPKNAMTLDNATWMYSSGPYGDDAPLPTDPTYNLMLATNGFVPWVAASGSSDSLYEDLSMLVTFGEFDLSESEPIEIIFAVITGRTGETDFLANADKAYAWAGAMDLIVIIPPTCCIVPGDANNDGSFNVGDAVFTIAHVFKGGPAPACKSAADANHDNAVNVGDAVYSISAVFKGGPPPECGQID